MFFKFALPSLSILLASLAIATPQVNRLARLQGGPQSHSLQGRNEKIITENWNGCGFVKNNGTFSTVSATFAAPAVSGPDGTTSFIVAIDGAGSSACENVMLQSGIEVTLSNGVASYTATGQFYPQAAFNYTNVTIRAGDIVRASVIANSSTSATMTIENLTNGQTGVQYTTSSTALCQQTAEVLAVADYEGGPTWMNLVDFGDVTFSNISFGSDQYTLENSVLVAMALNYTIMADSYISDDNLIVKFYDAAPIS